MVRTACGLFAVLACATRHPLAATLEHADAIAKLPAPQPPADGADAARLGRGRDLVHKYRCDFCHSASLAGRDNVPRIATQREDFLVKTLREYKGNVRPGYDASMADVLQPVTDAEIADLAYFASRQP